MKYTKKYQQTGQDSWNRGISWLNPYNYTRPHGTSPLGAFFTGQVTRIPEVPATEYSKGKTTTVSKGEAFRRMHDKLGPGKMFLHNGVRYTTNHAGEITHGQTKDMYNILDQGVADGNLTEQSVANLKKLHTSLGQGNMYFGWETDDEPMLAPFSKMTGADVTSRMHVNSWNAPNRGTLYLQHDKEYYEKNPDVLMNHLIKEFPHVYQQGSLGRWGIGKHVLKDILRAEGSTLKEKQGNTYHMDNTIESDAHGPIEDMYKNYIYNNGKIKYPDKYKTGSHKHRDGGHIYTGNLKRKYQQTKTGFHVTGPLYDMNGKCYANCAQRSFIPKHNLSVGAKFDIDNTGIGMGGYGGYTLNPSPGRRQEGFKGYLGANYGMKMGGVSISDFSNQNTNVQPTFKPYSNAVLTAGYEGEVGSAGSYKNYLRGRRGDPMKWGIGAYASKDLLNDDGITGGLYANYGKLNVSGGYNTKTGPEAKIGFGIPIR